MAKSDIERRRRVVKMMDDGGREWWVRNGRRWEVIMSAIWVGAEVLGEGEVRLDRCRDVGVWVVFS